MDLCKQILNLEPDDIQCIACKEKENVNQTCSHGSTVQPHKM